MRLLPFILFIVSIVIGFGVLPRALAQTEPATVPVVLPPVDPPASPPDAQVAAVKLAMGSLAGILVLAMGVVQWVVKPIASKIPAFRDIGTQVYVAGVATVLVLLSTYVLHLMGTTDILSIIFTIFITTVGSNGVYDSISAGGEATAFRSIEKSSTGAATDSVGGMNPRLIILFLIGTFAFAGSGCTTSPAFRASIPPITNLAADEFKAYVVADNGATEEVRSVRVRDADELKATVADQKTIDVTVVDREWNDVSSPYREYIAHDPTLRTAEDREIRNDTPNKIDQLIAAEKSRRWNLFGLFAPAAK